MPEEAGYLTIGKVVKRLQPQYPDLSISKVRYLEDEGLLNPSRTSGGYRLYSQRDVNRLERILYLQKNRFLPLSVIKEQLDSSESNRAVPSAEAAVVDLPAEDPELRDRLHPIDRMPELVGSSVSFVRQLSEAGVIALKRSPHGRDLVDGRDFPLIRLCDELNRFGFGPKVLRQYVTSANREEPFFEHALVVFAKKGGGVEVAPTDESRRQFSDALTRMLQLTGSVRAELIKRKVYDSFKDMED